MAQRTESVVALAGGVGGAKLAQGLSRVISGDALTVVVNTADDFDIWGLRVCPDLDTVVYTLAGLANPVTGWGIAGDSHGTLDALARLGVDTWFQVGDQDFATHINRTAALQSGQVLSDVMGPMARALGIAANVLPMTDDAVATIIETPAGPLDFQEYFVARRHQDEVVGVTFDGVDAARPGPGVLATISDADVVVFCPSNPIVSIGPILAVPGIRNALASTSARRIAVSPIVGGRALKGPADHMLATLGHEVSSAGVARIYAGLIDTMVIDERDRDEVAAIRDLGIEPVVTDTVMGNPDDRERLARVVLDAALAGSTISSQR